MGTPINSRNRLPESYSVWDVMLCLYYSEINCGVSSFWDAGFTIWLGDESNGRDAQFFDENFSQLARWLHYEALRLYPNSTFAAFNPVREHMHVAGVGDDIDTCRQCGRDIRDPIHSSSKSTET